MITEHADALWIQSADDSKDLLVPLHAVGQLTAYQSVPMQEALGMLREAARTLAPMDDSMGA